MHCLDYTQVVTYKATRPVTDKIKRHHTITVQFNNYEIFTSNRTELHRTAEC